MNGSTTVTYDLEAGMEWRFELEQGEAIAVRVSQPFRSCIEEVVGRRNRRSNRTFRVSWPRENGSRTRSWLTSIYSFALGLIVRSIAFLENICISLV